MGEKFDDVVHVAVNDHVPESEANLLWILKNLQFDKLVLLHVHAPFSKTTFSCGYQQSEIDAIKESQVKDLNSSFYKYRVICKSKGVNGKDVNMLCIAGDDVGEGIMKLIKQNNIKKLVMGAAADPHYSKKMSITSRKAKYVSEHAPRGCKMWFICKGKLITTKQGSVDLGNSPDSDNEHPDSIPEEKPEKPNLENLAGSTPPHEFFCPLTKEIMKEPYLAADGHTYEAEVIREYLSKGNKISPITQQPLQHYNLTLNRAVYAMIKDWQEENPNYED